MLNIFGHFEVVGRKDDFFEGDVVVSHKFTDFDEALHCAKNLSRNGKYYCAIWTCDVYGQFIQIECLTSSQMIEKHI